MVQPVKYAPVGRIDSSNSRQHEAELLRALEQGGGSVVVDFSRIEFLSSAGLRVLLVAANAAVAQAGEIRVCGAIASVREVLVVCGFDDIVTLVD